MPDTPGGMTERQKSLAFFTLIIALVLEIVDLTIVNTALPAIQANFGGDGAAAQWIVAGYSFCFALLLILGGRLGDIYGCRVMFLLGVTGFTLASLACGISANTGQLVAARMLQGCAGAVMAPQVLAMIQVLYDPVERVGRLAWFGVIGGLSAITGPILGGLLIAADIGGTGWRSVFLINGPVGLLAIVAGWTLLPHDTRKRDAHIDFTGTAMFGAAIGIMLFPLIRGDHPTLGLGGLLLLAVGPLLLVLSWSLLKRRARAGRKVIFDPALMSNRIFRKALGVALTFTAANTGFLFIFAYSLQRLAGFSPLQTGLVHGPFSAGVMFGMAMLGRRLAPRLEKWVLVIGAIVLAVFYAATLSWIELGNDSVPLLVVLLIAAGTGMGMLSGPIPPIAVARVEVRHAGASSGIIKTVQQMGGALGVALVGSAFFAMGGEHSLVPAIVVIEALLLLCAVFALSLPPNIFPARRTPD